MIRKTWTSLLGTVSVGVVSFGASSTINAQQYTFYPPPYQVQQYECSFQQGIVNELMNILHQEGLIDVLKAAIEKSSDMTGICTLNDYFQFVGFMVDWSPDAGDLRNFIAQFYYIVDQAPEDQLNKNQAVNDWMNRFAQAWGACLNTPMSTQDILTFKFDPRFKYHDYRVPLGDQWRSFNEFFSRELKQPRPVDPTPNAIVFPADSTYAGFGYVSKDSTVTAKGVKWNASDLLAGSRFKSIFDGGKWIHSFLDIYDYHRYHLPVGGTIMEVLPISGRVYLEVTKELVSEEKEGVTKKKWILDIKDGDKYQYRQQRGAVVIDSPEIGCVAVLPIGMAQVSSVNLTVLPGQIRRKGDEFGYFLFGGSDIIVLFQKEMPPFEWEAKKGTHYLQGETLVVPACKTKPCTPSCTEVLNSVAGDSQAMTAVSKAATASVHSQATDGTFLDRLYTANQIVQTEYPESVFYEADLNTHLYGSGWQFVFSASPCQGQQTPSTVYLKTTVEGQFGQPTQVCSFTVGDRPIQLPIPMGLEEAAQIAQQAGCWEQSGPHFINLRWPIYYTATEPYYIFTMAHKRAFVGVNSKGIQCYGL